MSDYQLLDDFYLQPTPAGAFYAISQNESTSARRFLLAILRGQETPLATMEQLCKWFNTYDEQVALKELYAAQKSGWIQGYSMPRGIAEKGIGKALPELLSKLSSIGKASIVDSSGFSLASSGLDTETIETLAALSADLAAVQARHSKRLSTESLGISTQGWGAIDAYGSSRIGIWPLYIGEQKLMLVLLGEPRMNQANFVILVWTLIHRYGSKVDSFEPIHATTTP